MKSKLILVEGIPGSGKSTFAERIAAYYTGRGLTADLYTEGRYHPADLAWNAYIPAEDLDRVLAPFRSFRDEIEANTRREDGFAILSYTQVPSGTPAFFKAMEEHEIYDGRIPFSRFREILSKRWYSFGKEAAEKNAVTVFECAFLQNQVNELMLIRLADIETMKRYFQELLLTVLPLSPVLVYLAQSDVKETVARAAAQRVSGDNSWIDGFICYMENTPYGKKHGIRGFDGVIRVLEERQKAELEIIRSLPVPGIVLENTCYDWEALWEELESKLLQVYSV